MNLFPIILIGILAAGILVFTLYIRRHPFDEIPTDKKSEDCDSNCLSCGDICAAGEVLRAQMTPVTEDFDDDELDAFTGRSGDDYTEEEEALFADILDSLKPSEAAQWAESLRRRNIPLPSSLRDEVMMLIDSHQ